MHFSICSMAFHCSFSNSSHKTHISICSMILNWSSFKASILKIYFSGFSTMSSIVSALWALNSPSLWSKTSCPSCLHPVSKRKGRVDIWEAGLRGGDYLGDFVGGVWGWIGKWIVEDMRAVETVRGTEEEEEYFRNSSLTLRVWIVGTCHFRRRIPRYWVRQVLEIAVMFLGVRFGGGFVCSGTSACIKQYDSHYPPVPTPVTTSIRDPIILILMYLADTFHQFLPWRYSDVRWLNRSTCIGFLPRHPVPGVSLWEVQAPSHRVACTSSDRDRLL